MTEKEQKAHDLFFQTNLNQQQIADLLSVNRKTLYGWIKEGKWLRAKCAADYAPMVLAEQYYAQLAAINNKIADRDEPFATKEEADIIRKLTITVNTIGNEKRSLSESIQLFECFTRELKKKEPELTKKIMVHMEAYIQAQSDKGWARSGGKQHRQEKEFEHEYQQWVNSHLPPSPPDEPTPPPAEPPIVPAGPVAPVTPGTSGGHLPGNDTKPQPPHNPPLIIPQPPLSSQNRVQNRVLPNQHDSMKPATTATPSENDPKNLSTITKEKQGVMPLPVNRRQRRLQERILKSRPGYSKQK